VAMEALKAAVVARIKAKLPAYNANNCGSQPDGQPPASCGEVYVAVHAGPVTNESPEHELHELSYAVTATLTMRSGRLPADRVGTGLIDLQPDGMEERAKAIALAVAMSYTVLDTANGLLTGQQPFTEPLRLLNWSQPVKKAADWFSSKAEPGAATPGWAIEIRWGHCRRPEPFPDASDD
jgi:hypothetical protein